MRTEFKTYPAGTWADGSIHGDWQVQPSGGQTVKVVRDALELNTTPVGNGTGTYASLVTSVQEFTNWSKLTVDYRTLTQHRTGTQMIGKSVGYSSISKVSTISILPS